MGWLAALSYVSDSIEPCTLDGVVNFIHTFHSKLFQEFFNKEQAHMPCSTSIMPTTKKGKD